VGAQDVRTAVVGYLGQPPIPGLLSVYRGQPVIIEADSWAPDESSGWGATAYIHLSDQRETRISMGGPPPGGIKRRDYAAAIVVVFRWIFPGDDDTSEADGWTAPFDGLIDDICTRMRADRTFGCGPSGPVWQGAEGMDDLRVLTDLPSLDDGQLVVWAALEFEITEMLNA